MDNVRRFETWVAARGLAERLPRAEDGIFWHRGTPRVLPWVRLATRSAKLASRIGGAWHLLEAPPKTGAPDAPADTTLRARFLRADQLLATLAPSGELSDGAIFLLAKWISEQWLVAIGHEQVDRPEVWGSLIATLIGDSTRTGKLWIRRAGGRVADRVRTDVRDGIDPVHTPEGENAGLTRHLCEGWSIGNDGALVRGTGRVTAVTAQIPSWSSSAPRRVMLGASLSSHALALADCSSRAVGRPHGATLLATFATMGGRTHEDAIVLSTTAAEKLAAVVRRRVCVDVPAVCSKWVARDEGSEGDGPLVEAFVDLRALGLDGIQESMLFGPHAPGPRPWRPVGLPGARAGHCWVVKRWWTDDPPSPYVQGTIAFEIEERLVLRPGDKLATQHGIKGVVSAILPPEQMPSCGSERAEIAFSPLGTVRRGALGMFAEMGCDPATPERPHGPVLVMRLPHLARKKMRAVARHDHRGRGVRYGQMEFWALMAHGAGAIARELTSRERACSAWLAPDPPESTQGARFENPPDGEEELPQAGAATAAPSKPSESARARSRRFLEVFLSALGVELVGAELRLRSGQLTKTGELTATVRAPEGAHVLDARTATAAREHVTKIRDEATFSTGTPVWIRLPEAVSVAVVERDRATATPPFGRWSPAMLAQGGESELPWTLSVEAVPVVPAVLRRDGRRGRHPLTQAYVDVIVAALCVSQRWTPKDFRIPSLATATRRLYGELLSTKRGLPKFMRREILERRLTGSATAVAIPAPHLRIDEIEIPRAMAATLFGPDMALPERVLLHRYPTLHRRGIVAVRPSVRSEEDDVDAIGLPAGILGAIGADFDGDMVCVVALYEPESLAEAKKLAPGADDLRVDDLRIASPSRAPAAADGSSGVPVPAPPTRRAGFRLQNELANPAFEDAIATSDEDGWYRRHEAWVKQRLAELGSLAEGWRDPAVAAALAKVRADLNEGLGGEPDALPDREAAWVAFARDDMRTVHESVRRKGLLGGALKRELARTPPVEPAELARATRAIQAVTERLAQSTLSVKKSPDKPVAAAAAAEGPAERATTSASDATLATSDAGVPKSPATPEEVSAGPAAPAAPPEERSAGPAAPVAPRAFDNFRSRDALAACVDALNARAKGSGLDADAIWSAYSEALAGARARSTASAAPSGRTYLWIDAARVTSREDDASSRDAYVGVAVAIEVAGWRVGVARSVVITWPRDARTPALERAYELARNDVPSALLVLPRRVEDWRVGEGAELPEAAAVLARRQVRAVLRAERRETEMRARFARHPLLAWSYKPTVERLACAIVASLERRAESVRDPRVEWFLGT